MQQRKFWPMLYERKCHVGESRTRGRRECVCMHMCVHVCWCAYTHTGTDKANTANFPSGASREISFGAFKVPDGVCINTTSRPTFCLYVACFLTICRTLLSILLHLTFLYSLSFVSLVKIQFNSFFF